MLNIEEIAQILRCQNGTTNSLSSIRRYNPYVYTEHGIIALAGILKSDVAAEASVEIRVLIKFISTFLLKLPINRYKI